MISSTSPIFNTHTPTVINNESDIAVTLPILNSGQTSALSLTVVDITLRSTARLSPIELPLFIGNLATDNVSNISARFDSNGLTIGESYLLTVKGTYVLDNELFGFSVNRYIHIPAITTVPLDLLKAMVSVVHGNGLWIYTIHNDELVGSENRVATFSLDIAAPIVVTGTPPGWEVETDGTSFVLWIAADEQPPFPNHVAPENSLGGFQIQSVSGSDLSSSTAYALTSWNQDSGEVGPVYSDLVPTSFSDL